MSALVEVSCGSNPKSKLGSFFRAMYWVLPAIHLEVRFQMSRLGKPPQIWVEDLRAASIEWGRLLEFFRVSLGNLIGRFAR